MITNLFHTPSKFLLDPRHKQSNMNGIFYIKHEKYIAEK
jgi:hypothetical protein